MCVSNRIWFRRQFDLANREALDESAEWRLRFDEEAERNIQCMNELKQVIFLIINNFLFGFSFSLCHILCKFELCIDLKFI